MRGGGDGAVSHIHRDAFTYDPRMSMHSPLLNHNKIEAQDYILFLYCYV